MDNLLFMPSEDDSRPAEPPRLIRGAAIALVIESIAIAVAGVIYAVVRFIFG